MPRKRRESEIQDGEIAIRDRKPSVSQPRCFGWMASRLLAVADSRSWELGRGPTGDRGGGVSNSRQVIRNHGRDRRQPSRLECSDGRWASVVGPKPPKGNYRWAPKFWGPGVVEPLALGQNRASPTITWKVPLYLTWR